MILETVRVVNQSKRIKVIGTKNGIEEILVKSKVGVPVNKHGEMYIHYADPKKYHYVTAEEVFLNKDPKLFAGRIVVIGLDAAGVSYLKDTPFQLMTDQQISAQALDTLLTESYLLRPTNIEIKEIIITGLLGLLLILILPRDYFYISD